MAADSTISPYKDEILNVHFWITIILIVLCLIYAIPAVYKRSGKIQYFLSIIVGQNMAPIPFLIMALFLIGKPEEGMIATPESLLNFTYILLFIGLLIFVATCIRFYILLRNGHYRKGSKKGELRGEFEKTSYIPTATITGVGLVLSSNTSLEIQQLMILM